jgi:hypothetical protein
MRSRVRGHFGKYTASGVHPAAFAVLAGCTFAGVERPWWLIESERYAACIAPMHSLMFYRLDSGYSA